MAHRILRRWWPILALTAAFVLILALVPPVYEVPQNDDWAYYLAVQRWLATGRLEHLGWNDPTLVFLVAWGALFAKVFGLSYTTLRVSALALSWIGVLSLYDLLRRLRARPSVALLGAGAMLVNPVYLTLSYSFNTDVPYLALATLATTLFLRARDRGSVTAYGLAGLASACAYLIRQQALFLAFGALAWIGIDEARRRRIQPAAAPRVLAGAEGRRRATGVRSLPGSFAAAVALAAPMAAAMLWHALWYRHVTGGRSPAAIMNLHPFFHTHSAADLRDLAVTGVREGVAGLLGQGVLMFPLVLAVAAVVQRVGRTRRSSGAIFLGFLAVCVAASFWMMHSQEWWQRGWPYQGPYLTRRGALPPTVSDLLPIPSFVWIALTALAPLLTAAGATALVLALRGTGRSNGHAPDATGGSAINRATRAPARISPDPRSDSARLVVMLGLLQLAPMLAASSIYDRYFITLLPALIAAIAVSATISRRGLIAGMAGLALLAGVSIEWTRAGVDRARAWWNTAEDLRRTGVAPEEIEAGFEWDGAHLFLRSLEELGARPPFHLEEGEYPWNPLLRPRYLVEEIGVAPGQQFLAERSYRPFFARRLRPVVIRGSGP